MKFSLSTKVQIKFTKYYSNKTVKNRSLIYKNKYIYNRKGPTIDGVNVKICELEDILKI